MSALEVSAMLPGSGGVESDAWDSDGSEDSVFSIDDHHLPWEVTEKLLLAENSDIQLVSPQISRSIWPTPNIQSERNTQKSAVSGSGSLFAYLPLAPLPQTIQAAKTMAEKIAEQNRIYQIVARNRFRKLNRHDKSSSTGNHYSSVSSYAIPGSIRVTGCKQLPHNIYRDTSTSTTHLPRNTGLNITPYFPLNNAHARLPSRTVSAPSMYGRRTWLSSRVVMRERNVNIGIRSNNGTQAVAEAISSTPHDSSELVASKISLGNTGSEVLSERNRPQTAPRERNANNEMSADARSKRPASARRPDIDDLHRISQFQISTEIKEGLFDLSNPLSHGATNGSPLPSIRFDSLPGSQLDTYSLPNGLSIRSSSRLGSPISTTRSKAKMPPHATQGQLNPWDSGDLTAKRSNSKITLSRGKIRSRGSRTRDRSNSSGREDRKNTNVNARLSRKGKKKLKEKSEPKPKGRDNNLVMNKTSAHSPSESTRTLNALETNSSEKQNSDNVDASTPSLSESLIRISEVHKHPARVKTKHGIEVSDVHGSQKAKNKHNTDGKGASSSEVIQLYPQDVRGSKHILFESSQTSSQQDERDKNDSTRMSNHHPGQEKSESRDSAIALTSPGRLPSRIVRRSCDSVFAPKNVLFENRKKKRGRHSKSLRSEEITDVSVDGKHFQNHEAAMKAKATEALAKAKSRAKVERRMRKARRARERQILGKSENSSRPSSAASWSSSLSDHPRNIAKRIEILNEGCPPPPPGWQEHLDLQTGRVFYLEVKTGKTTWENPSKQRPSRVESRGMLAPVGARLHTPVVAKRVKQNWTEYLPPPETNEYKQPWE